jgi:hypothetical protein
MQLGRNKKHPAIFGAGFSSSMLAAMPRYNIAENDNSQPTFLLADLMTKYRHKPYFLF